MARIWSKAKQQLNCLYILEDKTVSAVLSSNTAHRGSKPHNASLDSWFRRAEMLLSKEAGYAVNDKNRCGRLKTLGDAWPFCFFSSSCDIADVLVVHLFYL